MPFSRISWAASGRAVTCVTSSFSMTSMRTLSGEPRSSTAPLLTRWMSSSVCVPGTVSGGMSKGELGRATSSFGSAKLGPRRMPRTSASGAKGGNPPGGAAACRYVLTMVAMPLGTVCWAGSTRRPRP
jgi:hypothetical protein